MFEKRRLAHYKKELGPEVGEQLAEFEKSMQGYGKELIAKLLVWLKPMTEGDRSLAIKTVILRINTREHAARMFGRAAVLQRLVEEMRQRENPSQEEKEQLLTLVGRYREARIQAERLKSDARAQDVLFEADWKRLIELYGSIGRDPSVLEVNQFPSNGAGR